MPVNPCSESGKPGFKWGEEGKCYLYTPGNEKSMNEAKRKATIQGIATGEYEKVGEVSTTTMGSGLKHPQQGYGNSRRRYKITEEILFDIDKSLTEWFREKWVDLSRPKAGGGYQECGRSDASSGKYPKCVPAARAARMTPEQIRSAIRRKRRAESTQSRDGKKPIYVSTIKKKSVNVPTNPKLYSQVKAEAKAKFDVYPSAYANAWLVREYKKRGGGYRTISKGDGMDYSEVNLTRDEAMLAMALTTIAEKYGKFNEDGTGIWAGYESAEENDDKEIGVHCGNCVLYEGEGVCKIIEGQVEDMGKCRFAVIPDGLVSMEAEDEEEEMEDETEEENDDLLENLLLLLMNQKKKEDYNRFLDELTDKCCEAIVKELNNKEIM